MSSEDHDVEHAETQAREVCYRCFRPKAHCYCALVEPIANRTEVVILQHPRERFHPFGSARLTARSLERVRVEVVHPRELTAAPLPIALPERSALLYPSAEARDVSCLPEEERPACLVVIDGTWHHAKAVYRAMPQLHVLPKVRLPATARSRYRIRREPKVDYVSTLEATAHALRWLEPETPGLTRLLAAFDAMIDRQIETLESGPRRPRAQRVRRTVPRLLPRALRDDYERLVVVYGEAPPLWSDEDCPGARPPKHAQKQLVQWVARRPASGETFSCLVAPQGEISECVLGRMGLGSAALAGGISLAAARDAWRRFGAAGDIVAAWSQSTLELLQLLGHEGASVSLKNVYYNVKRGLDRDASSFGALAEIAKREALALHLPGVPGRGNDRLAEADALARWLHARARELEARS